MKPIPVLLVLPFLGLVNLRADDAPRSADKPASAQETRPKFTPRSEMNAPADDDEVIELPGPGGAGTPAAPSDLARRLREEQALALRQMRDMLGSDPAFSGMEKMLRDMDKAGPGGFPDLNGLLDGDMPGMDARSREMLRDALKQHGELRGAGAGKPGAPANGASGWQTTTRTSPDGSTVTIRTRTITSGSLDATKDPVTPKKEKDAGDKPSETPEKETAADSGWKTTAETSGDGATVTTRTRVLSGKSKNTTAGEKKSANTETFTITVGPDGSTSTTGSPGWKTTTEKLPDGTTITTATRDGDAK